DAALHVDEEHLVAALGEDPRQRKADIARPYDCDLHDAPRLARSAAATRSEACPSPYSGGASSGKRASSSARPRPLGSAGSTSVLAPTATVSTHSVDGLSVTHGIRSQYASFWRPPESVTTRVEPATRSSISR